MLKWCWNVPWCVSGLLSLPPLFPSPKDNFDDYTWVCAWSENIVWINTFSLFCFWISRIDVSGGRTLRNMFGGVVSLQVQPFNPSCFYRALCILRFPWRSCTRRRNIESTLPILFRWKSSHLDANHPCNLFSLYTFILVAVCDLISMSQFDNSASSIFLWKVFKVLKFPIT